MPLATPPLSKPELTLHRYYLWANRMYAYYMSSGQAPEERVARRLWLQSTFAYSALWLSLLFVVAEGWSELELHDEEVNRLLASPNRELLRRFRNGAFHFQPTYFDARFTEFFHGPQEPIEWASELHKAIGQWFIGKAASAMEALSDGI